MAKHTPGPWHWEVCRTMQHLQDASGSCFAGVSMPIPRNRNFHEYAEAETADANLIAAAPDMLEALKTIVASDVNFFIALTICEDAIKKAEGVSNG